MAFPTNTIIQSNQYAYYNSAVPNTYRFLFIDLGTGSHLISNAKMNVIITQSENDNSGDAIIQSNVTQRLKDAYEGKVIKHISDYGNTEEIYINSVLGWSGSTPTDTTYVNPQGGVFPGQIALDVTRGYNGTTIQDDVQTYSTATIYIEESNVVIVDTVSDGIKSGNSISQLGSFTELLNETIKSTSNSLDFGSVKLFVEENIIFSNVLQETSVREFLVMVNDLIVLQQSSSNKIEYINLIGDLIRVFDQSNLIDFVEYYQNVQEFLQMKISSSVLDTISRVLTVIVNDYFRLIGENKGAFIEYFSRSIEFIKLSNSLGIKGDILIQVSDSFRLSETLKSNIDINIILEEIIKSTFIVEIEGEQYECYALNLDNKALSRYTNYNFNSFAHFNNKYYALGKDGLYDLIYLGEDGEEVESKIKTSFLNVSDNGINVLGGVGSLQKSLKTGYFLVKNDGQIGLRIYTDLGKSFDYILKQDYNDSKFRTSFGGAVKGSMFQLELTIFDDFELEQCELIPIIHSKKI